MYIYITRVVVLLFILFPLFTGLQIRASVIYNENYINSLKQNISQNIDFEANSLSLALVYMNNNMPSQALDIVEDVLEKDRDNAYAQYIKGLVLFSQNDSDAVDELEKVSSRTIDRTLIVDSRVFALSSKILNKKYNDVIIPLQALYGSNPQNIGISSFLLGYSLLNSKKTKQALTYLSQSLKHDPYNAYAVDLSAQINQKEKNNIFAFQNYVTLLNVDSEDDYYRKTVNKLAGGLGKEPSKFIYYIRQDMPVTPLRHWQSDAIRVGMYANQKLEPQVIQSVRYISISSCTLTDSKMGKVTKTKPGSAWNINYDARKDSVVVTDAWGNLEYETIRPFYITADTTGASMLVKNVQSSDIYNADYGDRELRGKVWFYPVKGGFLIVSESMISDYLPSVLATKRGDIEDEEVLKALALILRDSVEAIIKNSDPAKRWDIADSDYLLPFKGVSMESNPVIEAYLETTKVSADFPGGSDITYSNAAVSESGVYDNADDKKINLSAPFNVFAYITKQPQAPEIMYTVESVQVLEPLVTGVEEPETGTGNQGPAAASSSSDITKKWSKAHEKSPLSDVPAMQGLEKTSNVTRASSLPETSVPQSAAGSYVDYPVSQTSWADIMWTLWIDLDAVNRRAKRDYGLDALHKARVHERNQYGRVTKFYISDGKKDVILENGQITDLLSPRVLRSHMFVTFPVYEKSGRLRALILKGKGTGTGRGLSVIGALNLRKQNKNYKEILRYYFPDVKFYAL